MYVPGADTLMDTVQAAVRGHQQRMAYMHLLAAVLTIQIGLRRWQLNCRVSARTVERRSREASAAAAAAADAERDGAERAAIEEKQRKERASFGAIKVSHQDHGLPKARAGFA